MAADMESTLFWLIFAAIGLYSLVTGKLNLEGVGVVTGLPVRIAGLCLTLGSTALALRDAGWAMIPNQTAPGALIAVAILTWVVIGVLHNRETQD